MNHPFSKLEDSFFISRPGKLGYKNVQRCNIVCCHYKIYAYISKSEKNSQLENEYAKKKQLAWLIIQNRRIM